MAVHRSSLALSVPLSPSDSAFSSPPDSPSAVTQHEHCSDEAALLSPMLVPISESASDSVPLSSVRASVVPTQLPSIELPSSLSVGSTQLQALGSVPAIAPDTTGSPIVEASSVSSADALLHARSSSAVSYLVYVPPVVTVSGSPRSLVSVPFTPTPLSELSGSVSSPDTITTPSCSSDLRNNSSDTSHVLTLTVGSELCSCVSLPRTSCVTSVTFSGVSGRPVTSVHSA